MNKQQRWRKGMGQFGLFLLLLLIGWMPLARTGYTENPVESIRSSVEVYNILKANPDTIPASSSETPGFFASTDLSTFPDVLFDIWFICLITAGYMILNYLFDWLVKHRKRR